MPLDLTLAPLEFGLTWAIALAVVGLHLRRLANPSNQEDAVIDRLIPASRRELAARQEVQGSSSKG